MSVALRIPRFDAQALCAEVDPELMFPAPGGTVRGGKELCRRCELRETCLAWALEHGEEFGIWGGTSEGERRGLRRQRRQAAA